MIFKETLVSLLDAVNTLQLNSLRISKTDIIDDIAWARIVDMIKDRFADSPTKIILCKNLISYPRSEIRNALIIEIHCSHVNGHKGLAKTYKRMRQEYFWSELKSDIHIHSRCLICQTNKLVRCKIRQPMILTDTFGDAFNKVSLIP